MKLTIALVLCSLLSIAHGDASKPKPGLKPMSKIDLAKIEVRKYAFEAYPSWSASNPDKACPAKLADLAELTNAELVDPWGHAYKMMCGKDLPKGAKGLAVSSPGPDGKPGTADDIKSWE